MRGNRSEHQDCRPAKVLILIESAAIRGAAKSVLTFMRGLKSQPAYNGGQVIPSLATFDRTPSPGQKEPQLATVARDLGFDVHVIQERRRWDPAALKQLSSLVNLIGPGIIHSNNVKSHAMVKCLGLHRRCKWIASHHGYTTTDFKMRCYNQVDRWSLRSASRVIVPCHAFKDQLSDCGISRDHFTVMPNSGELIPRPPETELHALRSRLGLQTGERVILCIGRLSAEKGHIDLIKAFRMIVDTNPGLVCRLLVVGSGPELGKLKAASVRLGVDGRVLFLQSEPDVTPLLHIAEVFALPSYSDGSPHVLFEAIGAGAPIVATCVGGVPEMLTDNFTAVLVEARRPDSLAAGLVRLLLNPALAKRLAEEALTLLHSRYAPEMYIYSLLRLYAEAMTF